MCRVTLCAEGRDAEIFRTLSTVKSPFSTLSPKLSHFHWTGKICDLLTSKREGCYTNTEITRLYVCVLYRSESPFINLHFSWTCPSDPFIKAGPSGWVIWPYGKYKIERGPEGKEHFPQLEKDVLKELVLGGTGMDHS